MRHTQLLLLLLVTVVVVCRGALVENSVDLKRLEVDPIHESTDGSRFNRRMIGGSTWVEDNKKSSGDESEERGRFSFFSKLKPHFKNPSGVKKPEILKNNARLVKELDTLPKDMETLKKNPEFVKQLKRVLGSASSRLR